MNSVRSWFIRRARDKEFRLVVAAAAATASPGVLAPVVALEQMRQSPASVCFALEVVNGDRAALERSIQSILRQTDPAWEIILCSTPAFAERVEDWLDIDWRIRRLPDATDGSLSLLATAIVATADFIGILDQGDVVDDDLVKRIGLSVRAEPEAEIIYTDELCGMSDRASGVPFHKPDWSPEHLNALNYVGRFAGIRKTLLLNAPSPDTDSREAAEYAILLEATRQARRIVHIDDALYINASPTPRPVGGLFSTGSLGDARRLLERHVGREDAAATVAADEGSGSLHVVWPLPASLPVTLVILTGFYRRDVAGRGDIVLATNFVRSIVEKSSATGYRILVVDDGVRDPEMDALLAAHGHESRSFQRTGAFSFAKKVNFAVGQVDGGIVLLLNDDLEVISPGWIEALAGNAARPDIGVVGGRLLFADGSIQHAGIALGFHGSAGHIFHAAKSDGSEYGGFASVDRNYSAVTGAVMAFRKTVFDELGGFDERFQVDFNDVDFCLRCIAAGYRIAYTPAATLHHFDNSSLKRAHDNADERALFLGRWQSQVARDPYFSKHFQQRHHDLPLLTQSHGSENGHG